MHFVYRIFQFWEHCWFFNTEVTKKTFSSENIMIIIFLCLKKNILIKLNILILYFSVEKCECPDGYYGYSCEDCALGYYRAPNEINPLGFFCTPCQCNGHADTCHPLTGECVILEPNRNPAGKCSETERSPDLDEDQCCQLYPDDCEIAALKALKPIKDGKCGEIERDPGLSEEECCEFYPDDCEMVDNKVSLITHHP